MCNGARFDHHARLVARMADRLGVDLETRVQSGEMLPEEIDLAVFDCMGCCNPRGCETLLDEGGRADRAPAFCRNAAVLEALAKP